MWRSYILRKCRKFWHSKPISCRKRCSKIQKIWHQTHALYALRNFTHIWYIMGLLSWKKCSNLLWSYVLFAVGRDVLFKSRLDGGASNFLRFENVSSWSLIFPARTHARKYIHTHAHTDARTRLSILFSLILQVVFISIMPTGCHFGEFFSCCLAQMQIICSWKYTLCNTG